MEHVVWPREAFLCYSGQSKINGAWPMAQWIMHHGLYVHHVLWEAKYVVVYFQIDN